MSEGNVYFECECGWSGDEDTVVDNTGDGVFNQCGRCGSTNLTRIDEDD